MAAALRCIVVIPARLASTRLPRKMLLAETGKPLIQHTYESASQARRPEQVIVATDHEEIAAAVRGFGGRVEMTDPDLPSGTDRVAEVARRLADVDVVVNVQGDEPEAAAEAIDLMVDLLAARPEAVMATVAAPLRYRESLHDPACVKVVCDALGRALYFSRSIIPYPREWDERLLSAQPPVFLQHMGLYAYRRDFLLQLAQLPPSVLEQVERLEQLRVLQAGYAIHVALVEKASMGIDTPDDYRRFVHRYQGGKADG